MNSLKNLKKRKVLVISIVMLLFVVCLSIFVLNDGPDGRTNEKASAKQIENKQKEKVEAKKSKDKVKTGKEETQKLEKEEKSEKVEKAENRELVAVEKKAVKSNKSGKNYTNKETSVKKSTSKSNGVVGVKPSVKSGRIASSSNASTSTSTPQVKKGHWEKRLVHPETPIYKDSDFILFVNKGTGFRTEVCVDGMSTEEKFKLIDYYEDNYDTSYSPYTKRVIVEVKPAEYKDVWVED
ncbi:hypothetical protein HMPREF1635_06890 [Clostridiales bacterium S5-A14a]|nr:hypothetical protein HMPREF1635_06890 [Clostridiales bacterium S5-A14a]